MESEDAEYQCSECGTECSYRSKNLPKLEFFRRIEKKTHRNSYLF